MTINYLGHSSFRIRGKDATVVTDPFDPAMVGLKYPKVTADLVTVSHDHGDHNYLAGVSDYKRVFDAPGEYEVGGISFIGVDSFHDDKKGEERGRNTIFVIEMDDMRLCHLGDLGHTLKEKTVDKIGEIDILFVPVGGVYTINPKQASEVTKAIDPKIIIPMHYKTSGHEAKAFGSISEVSAFVEEMSLKAENMDKLKIGISDLPEEEQRLVVLEG